ARHRRAPWLHRRAVPPALRWRARSEHRHHRAGPVDCAAHPACPASLPAARLLTHPQRSSKMIRHTLALTAIVALVACGGKEGSDSGSSAGAAAPAATVAQASFDPSTITPAMIALGDSIFHG